MAKFCANCGNELDENADLCLKCGALVSKKETKNAQTNVDVDKQATTGFTFGLTSIITWLIPLFGYITTICGIVYSAKGLKSTKNKTKATVGLVLSIIFLIVTITNSILGVINAFATV